MTLPPSWEQLLVEISERLVALHESISALSDRLAAREKTIQELAQLLYDYAEKPYAVEVVEALSRHRRT